jgi:rRNA maturation endonuclease Nob1
MTVAVIALMIVGLASLIASPFLGSLGQEPVADALDSRERLEREKNIALVAIREADLDRAMGKLSEDDYGSLRLQYEQRALQALTALDDLATEESATTPATASEPTSYFVRFCAACGREFHRDERFCPTCGRARNASA